MSFEGLVAFSATDNESRRNCKRTMRVRVENVLSAFGLEYTKTMKAMKEHGAVISGSSALRVLFAEGFEPGDIDFYVGRKGSAGFQAWIESESMYREDVGKPPTEPDDWYSAGRHGIREVKWLKESETGKKMNVVTTQDVCPISVILQFYTTLSMNIISWAGVGCAYPSLTTKRMGVLVGRELAENRRVQRRIQKAAERGFLIVSTWKDDAVTEALGPHQCLKGRTCPRGVRNMRTNRGLLCMVLDEGNEGEMQKMMPNVSWMMMDGEDCGDERDSIRVSTRRHRLGAFVSKA
ncbi:hypothetical protein DFP72DRAFT_832142 [Ephemerocybe angulata]|uniref:Uncharacterized protein n=1 Tax=Ephemerocybe angulata TaxID=980116 RepID=A0A8H6H9N2_9AGAR|nr:hypothetical protein DFP72DRAFT_832142 [Tulosesus angulatus]